MFQMALEETSLDKLLAKKVCTYYHHSYELGLGMLAIHYGLSGPETTLYMHQIAGSRRFL